MPEFGLFPGAFIGGYLGMLLGGLVGLLVGVVSRMFFYPPADPVLYRWVVGILSAIMPIFVLMRSYRENLSVSLSDSEFWQVSLLLMFVIIVSVYISQQFGEWYLDTLAEGKRKYDTAFYFDEENEHVQFEC